MGYIRLLYTIPITPFLSSFYLFRTKTLGHLFFLSLTSLCVEALHSFVEPRAGFPDTGSPSGRVAPTIGHIQPSRECSPQPKGAAACQLPQRTAGQEMSRICVIFHISNSVLLSEVFHFWNLGNSLKNFCTLYKVNKTHPQTAGWQPLTQGILISHSQNLFPAFVQVDAPITPAWAELPRRHLYPGAKPPALLPRGSKEVACPFLLVQEMQCQPKNEMVPRQFGREL